MATMKQIREGLADNIAASIPGFQVSAYLLANPTPPTIQVMPGEVAYHQAMRNGLESVSMQVQAFVALTGDIGSQVKLDQLLDGSLRAAVESDRTLGGTVDDLHVEEATGYRTAVVEGRGAVLLCEWTVNVMASN